MDNYASKKEYLVMMNLAGDLNESGRRVVQECSNIKGLKIYLMTEYPTTQYLRAHIFMKSV